MGFLNLNDIKQSEIVSGYKARFVHSENMTAAYWEVNAGAELPKHSHEHEQISNVTQGKFEFNLDGEKKIIGPGDIVIIPSGIPHSGKAITDCKIIDIFHPVREDYRK